MKISLLAFIFWGLPAFAAPAFSNLNYNDVISAVRDFSAMTDMSSISPATGLGTWGFEVGLMGGIAETGDLQNLADRAGAQADVNQLPRAALLGRLTFPHALTLEGEWLPPIDISGVHVMQFGVALQWTITDELWMSSWLDMALKLKYAYSHTSFHQTISGADAKVELGDAVYGASLIVSHEFGVIEPYLSAGYLMTSADLSVNAAGGGTIFDPSFSSSQSAHVSPGSWQGVVGVNFYPFPFLVLGAEYSRAFDVNSFTGKLSLQFD